MQFFCNGLHHAVRNKFSLFPFNGQTCYASYILKSCCSLLIKDRLLFVIYNNTYSNFTIFWVHGNIASLHIMDTWTKYVNNSFKYLNVLYIHIGVIFVLVLQQYFMIIYFLFVSTYCFNSRSACTLSSW